jgi:protein TonB
MLTPVPFDPPAGAPEPSLAVLPAVALVSLALHGILLAAIVLLPVPARPAPPPEAVAFVLIGPEAPPVRVAQPEPVPEVALAAVVVPAVERRVRRPRPQPVVEEPAPTPSAMTTGRAAGGEWAHAEGAPDGRADGVPDGTGTGPAVQADPAGAASEEARRGISRGQLRRMLAGYIRGTLSSYLDGRISYPIAARREHAEGVVVLRLRLADDGRILSVRLSRTSGHQALDAAALASVQGLGSVPAPPREIPWDDAIELPLPVTYVLQ